MNYLTGMFGNTARIQKCIKYRYRYRYLAIVTVQYGTRQKKRDTHIKNSRFVTACQRQVFRLIQLNSHTALVYDMQCDPKI